MTVINPNSISGVASVTAQGDIIQFYKSDGTLGAVQFDGANFNTTSGVSTFNNLYVGGVLTYEDVKNVDSVGIITARTGIRVTSGKVGIGTANPSEELDIVSSTVSQGIRVWSKGDASASTLSLRTGDSGNNYIDFGDNSDDNIGQIRYYHGDNSMRFVTNTDEQLRITNDGKVGIGSLIPADTLDVHGNPIFGAKNTSDAQLQLGRAGSGNRNAYIDFIGDNTYTDHGLRIIRKNAGPNSESQITHRGTGDFTVGTNEAAALRFATTSEERLRIESGGKIAIGNFSGATHDIHIKHANSPGIKLEDTTQSSKLLFFAQDANTGIGNFSNHDLVFYTNSTPVFRIDIDGKVGIGTDNPDTVLHLMSTNPIIKLTDQNQAADNKNWIISGGNTQLLRIQALNDAGGGGGSLFDFYRSGNNINKFRGMKAGSYWFVVDNNNKRVGIGTDDPDSDGLLTLHTDAADETLIRFDTGSPDQRRPWAFKQKDTGTTTALRLQALSNGKTFCVTNSSGTDHFSVHTGSSGSYVRMSAQVRVDDEIVHTGDDDTKISFDTDTIKFETAGGERLLIASDGQLTHTTNKASGYIATFNQAHADNPGTIQINSPTDNNLRPAALHLAQAGTVKWVAGQVYNSTSSQAFHICAGTGESNSKVTIDTAGRVFIGRVAQYASSSEKLSVNGMTSIQYASTSAAGLYIFNTESTTSGNPVQPFIFLHDGSGIRSGLGVQRSTGSTIFNGQFGLSLRTGSSGVGGTERLVITSTGTIETKGYDGQCFKFNSDWGHGARNVQIWNNADSGNWHSFVGSNLTYDGTNYLKPSDQANQNWGNIAGIVFEGANANNSSGNHPAIRFLVDLPAGNGLNYSLGSTKTAAIDNKTAACITSSGNFGIGTENPTSSLVVEGTIIANNGEIQVDKHIIDGSDDWAAASHQTHYKKTFTNGTWFNIFKFYRSDTAADNNDVGVYAGQLHIVYLNDRSNSVHTTGYDVYPFIVRARSSNDVEGSFASALVNMDQVIGSSVEVRFNNQSANQIDMQIKIYNSDAGGSERVCHAWIVGGGASNLSNRFLYPSRLT